MAKVSGGEKAERFEFIARFGGQLGYGNLCDWMDVSRSGFYAWRNRKPSARAIEDQRLVKKIRRIHASSEGIYGSPRIFKALKREGERLSRKRVERLMREAGLVGIAATKYRRVPGINRFFHRHRNLLLDLPKPTGINQHWLADITYLKVQGQWRYLAVVMDAYSRRIVGWSLGLNRTAALTRQALRNALRHRDVAPGLILHTDRGVEYGAQLLQDELKRHGIRSSMNRPGQCTDNATVESFFHTLKAEKLHGVSFNSDRELHVTLNGYINRFYNHRRMHSSLDYRSPAQYEAVAAS